MGVAVHHILKLERGSPEEVHALVTAVHAAAVRKVTADGFGTVGAIGPAEFDFHALRWLLIDEDEWTTRGVEIEPLEGWSFPVQIGDGCETASFGLCRYPETVDDGGLSRLTGLGDGWSYQAACKTQYASAGGWEHLLRCHRAVIELALLWKEAGVEVEIFDDGGYWPERDERTLNERVGLLNRVTAGLAGAMKDAAEEQGGPPVQSAIFEHPDFERLEAEGMNELGDRIDAARKAIEQARPRPPE